ncbi:unnamed protein product [Ilex paraguariensis]|uniref:1,4-dihydroxy-2-naphthoyl-CoA synthase n=1 Tax=Ilex paraguariensis TaxID=185542 RepID=A0ABC8UP47_9AQUA
MDVSFHGSECSSTPLPAVFSSEISSRQFGKIQSMGHKYSPGFRFKKWSSWDTWPMEVKKSILPYWAPGRPFERSKQFFNPFFGSLSYFILNFMNLNLIFNLNFLNEIKKLLLKSSPPNPKNSAPIPSTNRLILPNPQVPTTTKITKSKLRIFKRLQEERSEELQKFSNSSMARIAEKELETVRRRVSSVASHLLPADSASSRGGVVGSNRCSAPMNDSYHRIHGEVPSHEPVWSIACDESGKEYTDIVYEKAVGEAIAKVTINRPERRNAFRPRTIKELIRAFNDARDDSSVGVIILTGQGTNAFCSGGDQALRSKDGYADYENFGRLNVLDLQVQIRRLPKPVIAMVAGYAVGGGHVLQMVCDLTIAADNAIFGQTGPKVGSFDAGYGCSIMSRLVGPKKAREMWFLARFYTASEAEKMGLVNTVVPVRSSTAKR